MVTTAQSGKTGSITIGTAVAEVNGFTINREVEALDATSFDSTGNMEFIDGLAQTNGTFTSLVFLNKQGTQASATFQSGASPATNNPSFAGAIVITTEAVAHEVAGVVTYSYNYTFSGAVTIDITP